MSELLARLASTPFMRHLVFVAALLVPAVFAIVIDWRVRRSAHSA